VASVTDNALTAGVTTRLFAESDRVDLREIYLRSRLRAFGWIDGSSFRLDDFDKSTEGETIWVALRDAKLVGFVSVWTAENFLHNLFVHPDELGQGIGSLLLRESLNNIGRPAVLKCDLQNTAARDFYLSKEWVIDSQGDGPKGRYLLMHFHG